MYALHADAKQAYVFKYGKEDLSTNRVSPNTVATPPLRLLDSRQCPAELS
jgi:hypothetical protein